MKPWREFVAHSALIRLWKICQAEQKIPIQEEVLLMISTRHMIDMVNQEMGDPNWDYKHKKA